MITFISFLMHNTRTLFLLMASVLTFSIQSVQGQVFSSSSDTIVDEMNMDAVYERPFLQEDKLPVALGGYLEANTIHRTEDGLTEGLSFQARRLTMFMSASISRHIKFLSELEFEEGGHTIAIEFAALDIALHPLLNLRGGILMNPIGAFNQNHDGPKWEFVERPDVGVNLLPATFSNAGFGFHGKWYSGNWILGYEAYMTNGFDQSIIDNEENKTFLPAVKENPERFEETPGGSPLFSGKAAIKHRKVGEIGISYSGGVFNIFEEDGLVLDDKRRVDILAIDANTTICATGTHLIGEVAFIFVDVPSTYTQQYGNRQLGFFVDVVQPVLETRIFDWPEAVVNVAVRVDYVDWNQGTFTQTGTDIGDEVFALTPSISFRPTSQTVLRLNYRYQWQTDILGNPPAKSATWYFGLSTYF